jgi:hypothetical protein
MSQAHQPNIPPTQRILPISPYILHLTLQFCTYYPAKSSSSLAILHPTPLFISMYGSMLSYFIYAMIWHNKDDPTRLQSESPRLQDDPTRLQSESPRLQDDPTRLQSESPTLKDDPPRLQSDSIRLQDDPNRLQSESPRLQDDNTRLPGDPSWLRS